MYSLWYKRITVSKSNIGWDSWHLTSLFVFSWQGAKRIAQTQQNFAVLKTKQQKTYRSKLVVNKSEIKKDARAHAGKLRGTAMRKMAKQ